MSTRFLTGLVMVFFSGMLIPELAAQRLEKTAEETFSASKSTILDVDSKFGNVEVLSWENDEVFIEALMWVESKRESYAQELLDNMDVEIFVEENRIVARSVFADNMSNRNDTRFRIDFTISVPEYINFELSSKYGSAFIESISGHADIAVAYGNLKIQELTRGNEKPLNRVKLAYSSGNLEEASWIKTELAYSKLTIEEARAIMMLTKYSSVNIEEGSSLVIESKYDTYKVSELTNFLGELKYGNLSIGELSKKLDISSKYTSVKIDEIGSNFESIKIDNQRGGYKLTIDDGASFTINGQASRGDISVSGVENLNQKVENTERYISGKHGANPTSSVLISVKDGSVDVKVD